MQADDATELCTRPDVNVRSVLPSVVVAPAFVGQENWRGSARTMLAQKKPRSRQLLLFVSALLAMALLDGATFARVVGWWGPVDVMPTDCVPGVFVPVTLRALGGPGDATKPPTPSDAMLPLKASAHAATVVHNVAAVHPRLDDLSTHVNRRQARRHGRHVLP